LKGDDPVVDARVDPPLDAGERETLNAFLEWHRETLARKCMGLTDDQLRAEAVPPSKLSLLGLVRHMAEVERTWFRRVLAGEDVPLIYASSGDFQAAYDARNADADETLNVWRGECALAREAERRAPSLATTVLQPKWDALVSLRWILLHMLEEYARHNGHADLLRERIDGTTGE
jgi:uncharacterized damage-inducible protein DinB